MVCGNFILPEPASYVFFYAFSNLRNLLYIIESRAGAGALIEIFKSVGVLSEVDGKLSVLDEPSSARVSVASNTISAEQTHSEPVAQQALPVATISAKNSIVINININCTPADIDGLGEKISQLLYELSE